MWYLLVWGNRAELIISIVVAFNVPFAFTKHIAHFLTFRSSVTKCYLSFVIFEYLFIVIEVIMFPIGLSIMISWDNPFETFVIALSKSWIAMAY